jgi:RHS repeat-associated protein
MTTMTMKAMKLAGAVLGLLLWGSAQAGTVTYVYTDPQGTPLMETDAQGNITARYEYTPYGVPVASVGAAPDGVGYTGHVNDPETGLVYMQARYYDAEVGRFLSVDPVRPEAGNGFNFNRYGYVNNNPINNTDPDGRVVAYASDEAKEMADKARTSSGVVEKQMKQLESSKNTWTIKLSYINAGKDGSTSHVTPDSLNDSKAVSDGGTGKGSGGVISINKWTERVNVARVRGGDIQRVKIEKGEALAHELAHANQNDKGTTSSSPFVREHSARDVEDAYRREQHLDGERNNVKGN